MLPYLARDSWPCWYELSWRDGIVLRIHEDFVRIQPENVDPIKFAYYGKSFNLSDPAIKIGQDFGFGKTLKFVGAKEGYLEYRIPTPRIRKRTEKDCEECGGKGWDDDGENCFFCDAGKTVAYDWSEAYAVCASLAVLLAELRFFSEKTSAKVPQLMVVDTAVMSRMHGASLGGVYSTELASYLRSRNGSIPEMVAAMETVHANMWGAERDHFMAYTQYGNGWLNVICPGDACGLQPEHDPMDGYGYDFSSHNVDSPIQQLELLSSLAALHDLARTAGR